MVAEGIGEAGEREEKVAVGPGSWILVLGLSSKCNLSSPISRGGEGRAKLRGLFRGPL